jgi:hypothetical protein
LGWAQPREPDVVRKTPSSQTTNPVAPKTWLVDPRVPPGSAEDDLLRFGIHGEYGVRFGSVPSFRLFDYGFDNYRKSLGQTHRLEHFLRFSPQLTYRRKVTVRAQFDLPRGMFLGQSTDHVNRDPDPLNERQPMKFVPRYLYVDFALPSGHLTVGQQPASWALGLVDNSGDERQFFGDPRFGTIVDRLLYRGRPLGRRTPWELQVATDYVFSDSRSSALDGDQTVRGVIGNTYAFDSTSSLGVLVIAQRMKPHFDDHFLARISPKETTFTFDLAGQTTKNVPGVSAQIFVNAETAYVLGTTDIGSDILSDSASKVRRFGAIGRIGVIQTKGKARSPGGPLGVALEWGYASGDADPSDGIDHRFTMNPGRRIGLILFDEVLRWKSARSATFLEDPRLGQQRVFPNVSLPSAGGVFGATYLTAQFLYRPVDTFDLRAAATVAQSSSDIVDPGLFVKPSQNYNKTGQYYNFDGGDPRHRDLGLELDFATEYRLPLENGLKASFGLEAATLFPGQGLADDASNSIGRQHLVRGRFGFYF